MGRKKWTSGRLKKREKIGGDMNKVRRVLLFIFLFLMVGFGNGYGENETAHYLDNEGRQNGRIVAENMIEKTKGDMGVVAVRAYVFGAMDAIGTLEPQFFLQTYPNATKDDILEAVKLYYQNNPTQRHRAIVDVILSGCK